MTMLRLYGRVLGLLGGCSARRSRCCPRGRSSPTLTKASTTLTILVLGLFLFARGATTIGGIVMFMSFAGMLIQRLEQAASFVNRIFMDVPKLEQFFAVLDTTASVKDGKNAVTLKNVRGEVAFDRVSFSYDGKNSAVADLSLTAALAKRSSSPPSGGRRRNP